jgi:hypothetical protein
MRDYCTASRRCGGEFGIQLAGLLPTQHVKRFDELTDAINLGAEQAKLDDLFIAEVPGEIGIDLVFVDGVLALLEQIPRSAALPSHARSSACCSHIPTGR